MTEQVTDPYWDRVQQLFHELVVLPPDERARRLEAHEDAEVRAEVESLLASHEEADGFLATSLWELVDSNRQERLAGAMVGPYRLVRPIGEGGMGSVFLAVRDDGQYDQHVAIKLIRGGAAANSLVRRFLQERQILAAFEHPSIARLLDGGTTRDGLPYLVMEYVDGIPIDRYCEEHQLNTRAKVRLFLPLCDAVQYAHRNLVIHRDIKPANILITQDGTPKLLDFGIAKLMSHAPSDRTVTRMMTPDYASPEQLRGDPVTTATDVYSLGLVLYELLTGTLPFDTTRTADTEPVRPSTRTRELRGDLDNILLKAIDADPARRYASVEQLAEDLRRHLTGHPVLARGDSFGYRASKFVRRNKLVVSAAAIAFAAIVVAFAVTLRQKQIAERRFEEVRSLARAVVFDIYDAIAPLPGSTRARETLARQALVYLDNLAQEASDNVPLQMELATAYLKIGDVQGRPYQPNLGDTAGALRSYGKAMAIAEAAGESEPENAELRALVADAHDRIGVVQQRGLDWPAALREHEAALAIRQSMPSMSIKRRLDLAQTWVAMGDSLYVGGPYLPKGPKRWTPEQAYEESLRVLEAVPQSGPHRGELLVGIARANQRLGGMFSNPRYRKLDPTRCIRHHDAALRALAERVRLDPSSATARRNLADQEVMKATAQNAVGDHAGALASAQHAAEDLQKLAAADPTNVEALHDIAFAHQTAGTALLNLGRFDEAEHAARNALAILTRLTEKDATNREDRRGMIGVYGQLAQIAKQRGDAASEATYRRAAERLRDELRLISGDATRR